MAMAGRSGWEGLQTGQEWITSSRETDPGRPSAGQAARREAVLGTCHLRSESPLPGPGHQQRTQGAGCPRARPVLH